MLTREQIESALPANLRSAATQDLTDRINTVTNDPVVAENIRENFISFTTVLRDGKFKTTDYLNAVTYVSYKLMGLSNQDAYKHTFTKRWTELKSKNTSDKAISAYVSAYNKGKLVNLILEQTLTPAWILNQEIYQRAINQQAHLMMNAKSEKVQSDAANSLLTHLAKPKDSSPVVQIDINENSGMNEMRDMLGRLAQRQKQLIEEGESPKVIAEQKLIEGKVKEPRNVEGT